MTRGELCEKEYAHRGVLCFLSYLTAYLCRVDFSAALTALSEALPLEYGLFGKSRRDAAP